MNSKKMTESSMKRFLAYLKEEEKSQATISKYMHDITLFYDYLDDKHITKDKVIAYKQYLSSSYQPASLNSMLVALNQYLDFINLSSCKVKLQKIQRQSFIDEDKELTKKDYDQLLMTAKAKNDIKLTRIIQTIGATGIRVSELRYITVESLKRGTAIIENKGKIRPVPLPKDLIPLLSSYCQKNHITTGSIFITRKGNPINRSNLWKTMKDLAKEAGINPKKVFPHNLRHLFALTFYKVKKDIVRLADILGHSSIETTRIYTKTSFKEVQKVMNSLEMIGTISI